MSKQTRILGQVIPRQAAVSCWVQRLLRLMTVPERADQLSCRRRRRCATQFPHGWEHRADTQKEAIGWQALMGRYEDAVSALEPS